VTAHTEELAKESIIADFGVGPLRVMFGEIVDPGSMHEVRRVSDRRCNLWALVRGFVIQKPLSESYEQIGSIGYSVAGYIRLCNCIVNGRRWTWSICRKNMLMFQDLRTITGG
jgi:hypothetical protein